MKNINSKSRRGGNGLRRIMTALGIGLLAVAGVGAQNSLPAPGKGGGSSLPAPGTGGTFNPAPVGGPNGIGWNPGPGRPGGPATRPVVTPGWGANGIGWNPGPGWNAPAWTNQGTENVLACGYDAQGIWRTIPLYVSYTYNGFEYDVTVLNAWNPWSQSWNIGVDMPVYNTSYFINGQTYDFYTPLSTGTYYFNL